MKWLIDEQLPKRLQQVLPDSIHTLDLPLQNRTTNDDICRIADSENRVVITKDSDFVVSHLTKGQPKRLLLVSTGNIGTAKLLALFTAGLPMLDKEFATQAFIELTSTSIILRG